MPVTYLLLGSNQGDREYYLTQATNQLEKEVGTLNQQSGIYETAAWGLEDQPAFLNQVIKITTGLAPELLLQKINLIEKNLGRERIIKWGARVIDIDILYYDDSVWQSPTLVIPHPYLQERRFTLIPLAEIAPDYMHPVFNKTNEALLAACPDQLPAAIYKKASSS